MFRLTWGLGWPARTGLGQLAAAAVLPGTRPCPAQLSPLKVAPRRSHSAGDGAGHASPLLSEGPSHGGTPWPGPLSPLTPNLRGGVGWCVEVSQEGGRCSSQEMKLKCFLFHLHFGVLGCAVRTQLARHTNGSQQNPFLNQSSRRSIGCLGMPGGYPGRSPWYDDLPNAEDLPVPPPVFLQPALPLVAADGAFALPLRTPSL